MSRKTVKVGTVFRVPVKQQDIDESFPCDKDHCMLSLAGVDYLTRQFGKRNYRIKSTNHGMVFDIGGYRILTVFDHKTGHSIYQYDEMFKKTRNMQKAKSLIKPFTAKLMVESCQKIPTPAPMSEAKKAALAEWHKNNPHPRPQGTGIRTNKRRQLSE